MSANIYIVKPNSLETSKESGIKRVPARAKEFLNDTYFEKYDNTTIFYDVFTVGRKIFLIGPPLLNFMPILDTCTIFESNARKGTKVKVYTEHRDRSQLSWIDIPDNIESVSQICFDLSPLQNGKKDYVLSVSLEDEINFNELLKDSRALMTLQLDNALVWIQDWATFYNRIHQVDTVIIYDNGSSAYTVQEIADTVSAVEGIKNICIIQWNFKYGPQGKPWGTDAPWDSDFCQIGALQDARLRFLGNSVGMINADIDELFHPYRVRHRYFPNIGNLRPQYTKCRRIQYRKKHYQQYGKRARYGSPFLPFLGKEKIGRQRCPQMDYQALKMDTCHEPNGTLYP